MTAQVLYDFVINMFSCPRKLICEPRLCFANVVSPAVLHKYFSLQYETQSAARADGRWNWYFDQVMLPLAISSHFFQKQEVDKIQRISEAQKEYEKFHEALTNAKKGVNLALPFNLITYTELRTIIKLHSNGRYCDIDSRTDIFKCKRNTIQRTLFLSQGVTADVFWGGLPMGKSCFDLQLYMLMLKEIRPGTIFELGSANGSSALFFADMIRLNGLKTKVFSVELNEVEVKDELVEFIQGDVRDLNRLWPAEKIANCPHPWIMIEDCHAHVAESLQYFGELMTPGDYIVVEDTFGSGGRKYKASANFSHTAPGEWKVDQKYLDFCGYNKTCSTDTIFVKLK